MFPILERLDVPFLLQDADVNLLVAVLQSHSGQPPVFVYLDRLPFRAPDGLCITLDDLPDFDLSLYNGPIVSFSAVDVVRPELPTKGPRFHPIDPLLRQRLGQSGLNQTAYALATALLGYVEDIAPDPGDVLRARAFPKIISLALPSLLARRRLPGLIGVHLGPDLWAFLQDYAAQWIYLAADDASERDAIGLAAFESGGPLAVEDWLIALDEVQLFRPDVDPRGARFVDLRVLLRAAGHDEALRSTLGDLAQICYRRSEREPRFRRPAWSLMAEYWLTDADGEVDDLVCLIPNLEFDDFAHTGSGARFYRALSGVEAPDGESVFRLATLESLFDPHMLSGQAGAVALALPLFERYLRAHGVGDCVNLGYVLWRAGRTTELAQTLALLARDLVAWPAHTYQERGLDPEAAYDAAWRACLVLGLESPPVESRGFHDQMVRAAYHTLISTLSVLAEQSQPPVQHYYLGLAAWFGCYDPNPNTNQQVEAQLRQVARHMSAVCRDESQDDALLQSARHALDIANASVSLLSGSGQAEFIQDYLDRISAPRGSRSDYQRASAEARSRPPILSEFFVRGFQELAVLTEQVRLFYQSTLHEDEKARRLTQMQARLAEMERQLFALPHELIILRALYRQMAWQTENLAHEQKGSALPEMQLVTTAVQQHAPSRVTFSLRNVGRAPAEDVRVILENSERFSILSLTSGVEIERLPPGATASIAFDLDPRVDDELPLRITVTYRDQRGYHVKPRDFIVRAVGLDRGPFSRKVNPYIFGNPIQDPQHFYGRRAEVLSVVDHLAAGSAQNILLRGARRNGKTSVLYMLKHIIENAPGARERFQVPPAWSRRLEALRVVFLDLSGMPGVGKHISASEFYFEVSAAVARAVGLVPDPSIAPRAMNRVIFQQELERYLAALPAGGYLVLLLDEFDVVETITDPEFYYHLRHVITYLQRITWVVASAAGLYQAVQDYASPLFNVFRIVELTRLDPDDARRLILDPLAGQRVQFLDEAVEAVLEQTGCHPYFLQLLCSEVIEHINARETNYVLRSTVQLVVEKIVGHGRATYDPFAYLWDHTRPFSRLILAHLLAAPDMLDRPTLWAGLRARLSGVAERGDDDEVRLEAEFERHLLWLQNVVEAIVPDAHGHYGFGIPLFRYWLNERARREELFTDALAQVAHQLREPPDAST